MNWLDPKDELPLDNRDVLICFGIPMTKHRKYKIAWLDGTGFAMDNGPYSPTKLFSHHDKKGDNANVVLFWAYIEPPEETE